MKWEVLVFSYVLRQHPLDQRVCRQRVPPIPPSIVCDDLRLSLGLETRESGDVYSGVAQPNCGGSRWQDHWQTRPRATELAGKLDGLPSELHTPEVSLEHRLLAGDGGSLSLLRI